MRTTMMAAALALAVGAVGAQEAVGQETMLGVKAGLVSANVDEDGADARTSAGFGGFARFAVAPRVSVQPEALYLQKGFGGEAEGVDSTFELDYVQVPVLLQYHFPVDGNISPRLFAGPALAFNLGCNVSGTDGSASVSLSCDDFADFGLDLEAKSVELALVLGGGLDIAAGSMTVMFDGRYDLGLSDVLEIEGTTGLKNRAWALFAGVGFPVGP